MSHSDKHTLGLAIWLYAFISEFVVCEGMSRMSTDALWSVDRQATYESYCQSGTRICRFSTDGYGSSLSTLQHPRLSLLLLQLFVQVSGSCLRQRGRDPHLQYFLEIRDKIQDRAFTYITCMACQNGKKWFLMAESERSIVIRIPSVCVWQTKKKKPLVAQVRRTCTVLGKIFA